VSENFDDVDCYFMHPVKSRAVIKSAYRVYGVRTFVVDHVNELKKIMDETGGDDLIVVVRVKTPAGGALYHLSAKFGAEPDEAAALLKEADKLGCETGVAFHVGSQCREPQAFSRALALVGQVLEAAGVEPVCLDVGGGFPSRYVNMDAPPLEDFIDEVRAGLRALKLKPTVEIMAEPGRALVATGCSLITQVQLRKDKQLYINDGIYGSLSETVQGGVTHPVRLVRIDDDVSDSMDQFILNGPTCDSLDVLPGTYELPSDVREGDWIEIDCVGAYSNALATNFNGFYPETFVEVFDDPPVVDRRP